MDSPNRHRLNAALVGSQQECNHASAAFQPADPYAFLVVIPGAVANDKTVFDTKYAEIKVPAEVLLPRHFICLMPLAAQLPGKPAGNVIPEATGIDEIFFRLRHVEKRAPECDHRFDCCVHS